MGAIPAYGSANKATGGQLGEAIGFSKVQNPYDAQLGTLTGQLQNRAAGNDLVATQMYKKAANEGMGNTLAGMAQTKGLRPSGLATMADIAGSRMQGQAAENAGVMALSEMNQNQNMLGNLLLNRGQQDMQAKENQYGRLTRFAQGAGAAAGVPGMGGIKPA